MRAGPSGWTSGFIHNPTVNFLDPPLLPPLFWNTSHSPTTTHPRVQDRKHDKTSSRPVLGRPDEGAPVQPVQPVQPLLTPAHASPNIQLLLVGDSGVGTYICHTAVLTLADSPIPQANRPCCTGTTKMSTCHGSSRRLVSTSASKRWRWTGRESSCKSFVSLRGCGRWMWTMLTLLRSGIRRGRNASAP